MLVFTDAQLAQIKMSAFQIPGHLRGRYRRRVAELLPKDFGDADVWRAAHRAAREIMQAPSRPSTTASEEHALG